MREVSDPLDLINDWTVRDDNLEFVSGSHERRPEAKAKRSVKHAETDSLARAPHERIEYHRNNRTDRGPSHAD